MYYKKLKIKKKKVTFFNFATYETNVVLENPTV